MICACGAKMCYICKAKEVDYNNHFYGQGAVATAKKTCPLWSDNKALHEEALAKAAEEAREKLKQENVTLDIDPLKGIAMPVAKQTKEEVKEGLFKNWYNMKAEVNRLPNLQHRIHLDKKLDKVFEKLQAQEPDMEAIRQQLEGHSGEVLPGQSQIHLQGISAGC